MYKFIYYNFFKPFIHFGEGGNCNKEEQRVEMKLAK